MAYAAEFGLQQRFQPRVGSTTGLGHKVLNQLWAYRYGSREDRSSRPPPQTGNGQATERQLHDHRAAVAKWPAMGRLNISLQGVARASSTVRLPRVGRGGWGCAWAVFETFDDWSPTSGQQRYAAGFREPPDRIQMIA